MKKRMVQFLSAGARIYLALAILFVSGISKLEASILNVANCSFEAVNAAVASAVPGDTVQLPAGTNVWTHGITISGISLKGAGTNQTVIIDEVSRANNGGQLFNLVGNSLHLTELSNLQLRGGTTNTSLNYFGTIYCSGTSSTAWRIDHILFDGLFAENIDTDGNSSSVIDHNTFLQRTIGIEDNSYIPGDGLGDHSYALPPTYGLESTNDLYIEDNYFTNILGNPGGACDCEGGARVVFRHNTVMNEYFSNHGTETGGDRRSDRSFEIYNNTFTYLPSGYDYPWFTACHIRGGSGVIYSNTATGYQNMVKIANYRSTDTFSGQWFPYGGANGMNPWDSNSPTLYLSGTSSSPNGSSYLQVSGANWTNNQWVGYTLLNTNSGLFSVVTANTTNKMTYIVGGDVHNMQLTFNTGDHFQLHLVYATLDQPGRGSGDLLADKGVYANGNELKINSRTGTLSWPDEVLEPMYFWSNTLNGANAKVSSDYPNIKAERDFYNDTPKPGYTPYRYPHPLAVAGIQPSGRPSPPVNLETKP